MTTRCKRTWRPGRRSSPRRAQVEQAQVNLDFTSVISPIDGIASIARAQIGDLVGPATGELTTVSTV